MYLCRPKDGMYSFGIGIYGIIIIGAISFILLSLGNWNCNSKLILNKGVESK
jgi:hypothetical protein